MQASIGANVSTHCSASLESLEPGGAQPLFLEPNDAVLSPRLEGMLVAPIQTQITWNILERKEQRWCCAAWRKEIPKGALERDREPWDRESKCPISSCSACFFCLLPPRRDEGCVLRDERCGVTPGCCLKGVPYVPPTQLLHGQ